VSQKTGSIDIRPSSIAGTWYPGEAENLAKSIERFLQDTTPRTIEGKIVGLVVPHAGHRYSGAVAAQAFRLIQGLKVEVVAVVSPLHVPADQPVTTSGHEAYETPLGELRIDQELVAALEATLQDDHNLTLGYLRNDREHSLEIELPFLQYCLKSPFMLLPIMLRDQVAQTARSLGQALGSLLRERNSLIIASSDLSHFYPQELAQRLDQTVLERVAQFDPEGVIRAEEQGLGFACGRGAIATTLWAARSLGADRVEVLKHATSGAVTGDFDSVVGYGSAVIYRKQ
jgi:AmmeMemoRadiSam system protein B